MSDQVQQPVSQVADDEIDLRELFSALWQGKWLIIVTTFLFSVASVFYALSLPDIYKSEVTLAPVSEDSGLKIPGQLGGLAALAGVNLGGMGGGDKTGLAMEILKSRDFIGRFIEQNDLYLPIMAAKGWDRERDQLIIDPKIYDIDSKQWVRKVKQPFQAKPSNQETYEEFIKLLNLNNDKKTGTIKISIEYYSPFQARDWLEDIVKNINEEMREKEKKEAEASIKYLNTQIQNTNIADVRAMLYSLVEEQTKKVMLANVRNEYIFKTIDPPVAPEKISKPNRISIVILGVIFSLFISLFFIFIRKIRISRRREK